MMSARITKTGHNDDTFKIDISIESPDFSL